MSDSEKPVALNDYYRLCRNVFFVALLAIGSMVAVSFAHLGEGWTLKVALILAIATVNAVLVAGYLMHLFSEKKLIYTVLGFTVFFVIGLFALTLWAMKDFPIGTAVH